MVKENPTVQVLLSSYNAMRMQYIQAQLDSLQGQTGVNVRILIRDDGSTDDTITFLEQYSREHENATYYQGENLKPAKSFLNLIENAPEAEYYALCDQDDVWDSDKLSIAVAKISEMDPKNPILYYSNLRIVDQDLNFIRLAHSAPADQPNKYSALFEPMPTGCTIVFNRALLTLVQRKMPEYCSMHDSWIYLIAKMLGTTIYDFEPHISYRQHGNNVIGAYKKKGIRLYIDRFLRLFDRKLQPRYKNAISFLDCFGDMLNEEDYKKVAELVNYKNSVKDKIRLLTDREIYASSKERDIRIRILILLGIL